MRHPSAYFLEKGRINETLNDTTYYAANHTGNNGKSAYSCKRYRAACANGAYSRFYQPVCVECIQGK